MHERAFTWIAVLLCTAAMADGPTTTTSAPTSRPAPPEIAAQLVALRSKSFKTRELAQEKLRRAGNEALPFVIPLIADTDDEVASRAVEIVGKPADPALRVEAAIQLLATADPDLMERAVHMLYENPIAVGDLFAARTKNDKGVQRIITEPIARHLSASIKRIRNFQTHYDKIADEKPEAAEKQKKMSEETNGYEAEAAYWTAYEALLEYRRQLISEPKDPPAPASQPGE